MVCCGIAPGLSLIGFCFGVCPELTTFGHYTAVLMCSGFGSLLPMLVQHGPVWISVVFNSPFGVLVPRASLDMSPGFSLMAVRVLLSGLHRFDGNPGFSLTCLRLCIITITISKCFDMASASGKGN